MHGQHNSDCPQYFLTVTLGGAFLSLDWDPDAAAELGVNMLCTALDSSLVDPASDDLLAVTLVTLLVLTLLLAAFLLSLPPAPPRELLFTPSAAGLVPPFR